MEHHGFCGSCHWVSQLFFGSYSIRHGQLVLSERLNAHMKNVEKVPSLVLFESTFDAIIFGDFVLF